MIAYAMEDSAILGPNGLWVALKVVTDSHARESKITI